MKKDPRPPMTLTPPPLPELLAPAGSLETFFAALDRGADAVYAGLKEFSARARARNFTLAEMERMTAYAHNGGKRLYVTINTIIKERELPLLVETLSALESFAVDGVIVQDLAVARIVRRHFPSIPLHASTQMTIHNSAGVRTLARLGFSRVVLARELTLDELREVIANSPIEVECFVHGALCFSWSGQCYFSSFLGGQSGNRGRCTQPCRRIYRHQGREGYYFSTTDFSAIDHIHDLRALGVASFKIEGRMKSAEYVATVVEAYRTVMDASPDGLTDALRRAKELLRRSYGRLPTKGFLLTKHPTDIAIPTLKGATGRYLGEVTSCNGSRMTFTTRDKLHVGDRIRIQPRSDQPGTGVTVRELFVGRRSVTVANPGSTVTIPTPFTPSKGDSVFKVSSETAYTLSEAACRRRLGDARPLLPLDLAIRPVDGEVAITAHAAGEQWQGTFTVPSETSRGSADLTEVFRRHFSQTGGTPFFLRSLELVDPPPLFIPPKTLKELRRCLLDRLEQELIPRIEEARRKRVTEALADLWTGRSARHQTPPQLLLRIPSAREIGILNSDGVSAVSLPLTRRTIHSLDQIAAKAAGRQERIVWQLPLIITESETAWYLNAIDAVASRGFTRFILANLGQFDLVGGKDLRIITDHTLFSLNSQAIRAWYELGAEAVTLSIEDDQENISLLLAADLPVVRSIILHAPLRLLTSRIPVKDARPDAPFTSDRGDTFRVEREREGTTLLFSDDFSITRFRRELQDKGCSLFQADLSSASPDRSRAILEACRTGSRLPRTTDGNFTRELS